MIITREWIISLLTGGLTRARTDIEEPIPAIAEGMTDELLERWLRGESSFWKSASQKQGITLQQRTMRIQVSRFYDQRLAAHLLQTKASP